MIADTYGTGNAGNLMIDTGKLIIQDGAGVSSSAFYGSTGRGGDLTVKADSVELTGTGTTTDGQFRVSRLTTTTVGTGDAGNLTIHTRQLKVRDGAVVGAYTTGGGQGGELKVTASDSVELTGTSSNGLIPSAISTDTFGANGAKNAGNLTINTGRLSVQDGAAVSVSTFGQGQGGRLSVNASKSVELSGTAANGFDSGLYAQSLAAGNAGGLSITTDDLRIQNGAVVTVAASNAPEAGVPFNQLTLQKLLNLPDLAINLPAIGLIDDF